MAAPSSSASECITFIVVFYIIIMPICANLSFYIFYHNIGKWYNVNEFEQDEDDPESANKPPVMKEKGG